MLCKCPQLTPLQSRFVASFLALCLLLVVFWSLSNPHFAYAAELEVEGDVGEDHNWHRIQSLAAGLDGVLEGMEGGVYEVDEEYGRELRYRAEESNAIAGNDQPNNLNIVPGQTMIWTYSKDLLEAAHADTGTGLPSNIVPERRVGEAAHRELRKRTAESEGSGSSQDLERRQAILQARDIFISMNTCLQPKYNGTGTQSVAPPQLTLYVSTSSSNQNPGPSSGGQQMTLPLDEGFVNVTHRADDEVYMAVHAPSLPNDFTGGWNYNIAVSIDAYFYRAENSTPFMYLVDSDTNAALLVTDNLTQADPVSTEYKQWMNLSAPFIMFAGQANDSSTLGISKSFCGLQNSAQIQAKQEDLEGTDSHVQMGMITRGLGDKPKQQFFVTALNGSSTYYGVLAMEGNSTASGPGVVGGGGTVWPSLNWTTKSDGNCQLMFNLSFCDKVAYAVPANPNNYANRSALAALYDSHAAGFYTNFTYSLQQIACNTTTDAQYSLSKNCTDCAAVYKEWLCAVSLPRCEDWSNPARWLQQRSMAQPFINGTYLPDSLLSENYPAMSDAPSLPGSPAFAQTFGSSFATNQSRNPVIDENIKPGPYKEVLPCEDLCFSLMQSCPAALGFGCPQKGLGREVGYGKRDGQLTCSYLGAVYYLNGTGSSMPRFWMAFGLAAFIGIILGFW